MDPLDDDPAEALELVYRRSLAFLGAVGDMRAATPAAPSGLLASERAGRGAAAAVGELLERYGDSFSGSSGPRYWGFVNGGVTPAALAGDWLCSAVDQNCQRNGDGAAVHIEAEALAMLREALGFPQGFHGIFVTGGTMANYTGLATALQALGRRRGVDVGKQGVAALGPVRILSGESHSSIAKSAGMLGLGRDAVESLPRLPGRESVDPEAVARRLAEIPRDDPVIIVGNAGTVITGDFDDLDALGAIARRHGAHFHVDGAFGAFAACSPAYRHLVRGIAEADTVASDGHKFLNVPFDSGFVFTRSLEAQVEAFKNVSTYQAPPAADPQHYIHLSPQNSRRLRALPAWLTLRAYGADGYRDIVERCAGLAGELGERLGADPGFRIAAPVRFNILAFQLVENGRPADADCHARFLDEIRRDGRVFVTAGELAGEPCARLALVNWRTTRRDLDVAMAAFRDCRRMVLG
jgi:glutamate/tyrosine decarboxylase-like PLP-dependent enzyme